MGTYDAYYFLSEAINAWGWIGWPDSKKYETYEDYILFPTNIIRYKENFDRELAAKKFREFLDVVGFEGKAEFSVNRRWNIDKKYVGQSALPIIKEIWSNPNHVPDFVKERWPEYFHIEVKEVPVQLTNLEEVVEYINE